MDGTPGTLGHAASAGPIPWLRVRDAALPGNRGSGRQVPPESSEHGRERRGREPALKAGPRQGKQQEQESAEAEEAQPASVGRC